MSESRARKIAFVGAEGRYPHSHSDTVTPIRSVRPFSQAARVLTCGVCQRTMAYGKLRDISGRQVMVCRPCRNEP